MKRGEIYRADLDPVIGSEQGGIRPVLIIQNDIGNLHSPTVIVAAITPWLSPWALPTGRRPTEYRKRCFLWKAAFSLSQMMQRGNQSETDSGQTGHDDPP